MNDPRDVSMERAAERCHRCGRALVEGRCFARLWRRGTVLLFCQPRCVLQHLDAHAPPAYDEPAMEDANSRW
jgi:hypothetical protein